MTEEFLTDDEQLEEVKRLVAEYAPWIIPAVIVGLGFVFGYRYYHSSSGAARAQRLGAVQRHERRHPEQ